MDTYNRQTKNEAFIFSVFDVTKEQSINQSNHYAVLKDIIENKIAYKIVHGNYTHTTGGNINELSFYIETNDNYTKHELYDYVKTQCINANQESFLHLSKDRDATLIPTKGEAHSIGVFTAVSEEEAKQADSYTYCPIVESYFIAK